MADSRYSDASQEQQNCETIIITFLQLVLPALQIYVVKKIAESSPAKIECDCPKCVARLYLPPAMKRNFDTLVSCSDYRILLTIMSRAPCFSSKEAELAKMLKETGNFAAHTDIMKFDNDYTNKVLETIETMFEVIPEDTQNYIRDLQQVKKYGLQALLQKRSGQQITAIRRSLDRAYSTLKLIPPSLKASIEASLRSDEEHLKDIEVKDRKMSKIWPKLPVIDNIVCFELDLVSRRGNIAGLRSLITKKNPKTIATQLLGSSFKICREPFEKGSTRLAFRGLFENAQNQTSEYFKHHPAVVVKRSKQDAVHFQKVHIYAHEFAKEWNKLRGKKEIIFLWIVSAKIPGFRGKQTIEPYLNKKYYMKW